AVDIESGTPAVLKTPSVDLSADPEYLERFLVEEWVARRIANAHVLNPCAPPRVPVRGQRVHRGPDAHAVDDRPSAARARDGARLRGADRARLAGLPPA